MELVNKLNKILAYALSQNPERIGAVKKLQSALVKMQGGSECLLREEVYAGGYKKLTLDAHNRSFYIVINPEYKKVKLPKNVEMIGTREVKTSVWDVLN